MNTLRSALSAVLLLLVLLSPAFAQFPVDRGSAAVTLDQAGETATVTVAGYQVVIVKFSNNTALSGTVRPTCSLDGTTFRTSNDYRFIQRTDGGVGGSVTSLTDSEADGEFWIWCGGEAVRAAGVRLGSVTAGSVTAQVWAVVNNVNQVLRSPSGVAPYDSSGNLQVVDQNKAEIAGQSNATSIDSYLRCRNRFNVILDANETLPLTPQAGSGNLVFLCDAYAKLEGTGSANIQLVEGTTTTTPCDTSQQPLIGDATTLLTLSPSIVPLIPFGSFAAPFRSINTNVIICAKSTTASSTNKIIVWGSYALAP